MSENQILQPQKITPAIKTHDKATNSELNDNHLHDGEFAFLDKNNSRQELVNELQSFLPGIKTGFNIGQAQLVFPGGALSIIAAPTSHGKTTSLINFCLGALEQNPEISAYFFSYEECAAAIQISFLNTFVGLELTKGNNKQSITNYLKDGEKTFIKGDKFHEFENREAKFFSSLLDNGRLKIFYEDLKAETLCKAIKRIKTVTPQSIIFIDYIQLLKLATNTRGARQEELKEICLMLKDCAVQTGLPIVLAAQFNRTVVSEAHLSPNSIGEAGDIERIASLIVGMYNRNFILTPDGNKNKNGEKIEKESTIYFEILKGRGIGNGHNCVVDFDGNIGMLTQRSSILNSFTSMSNNTAKTVQQKPAISHF